MTSHRRIRETPPYVRALVLSELREGRPALAVALDHGLSYSTVRRIRRLHKQGQKS